MFDAPRDERYPNHLLEFPFFGAAPIYFVAADVALAKHETVDEYMENSLSIVDEINDRLYS